MKQFNQFIGEYRAGVLNDILTAEMNNLTNMAVQNGKKASLSINIDIIPKHDGTAMVNVKYNAKEPKINSLEAVMFYTPEGDLLAQDPRQSDIFKGAKDVDIQEEKNVKSIK